MALKASRKPGTVNLLFFSADNTNLTTPGLSHGKPLPESDSWSLETVDPSARGNLKPPCPTS